MRIAKRVRVVLGAVFLAGLCHPASAQTFEAVGIRAQGMGGAFVAVADDLTATWWNPAGLAAGPFVGGLLEWGRGHEPRGAGPDDPARRESATGVAVGMPALAISYYRVTIAEAVPSSPTATAQPGRNYDGEPTALRSVRLAALGATFGQSVGDFLTVGTTIRLLRGGSTVAASANPGGALDQASELDVDSSTTGSVDIGAVATFGHARVGLTVRNLTEPELGAGASAFVLRRQARAGLAMHDVTVGRVEHLTMDVDVDLMRTATAAGDRRRVAAGVEALMPGGVLMLRAGVGASTLGPSRPSASVGLSLAARSWMSMDAAFTAGGDQSDSRWGLGLRVGF